MIEAGKFQVGGDHYKKMKIDPNYFGMANAMDTDAFQILKYVARHKFKGGVGDLEKAKSYIDIRMQHALFLRMPMPKIITMEKFIELNEFDEATANALRYLDDWIDCSGINTVEAILVSKNLRGAIQDLIDTYPKST